MTRGALLEFALQAGSPLSARSVDNATPLLHHQPPDQPYLVLFHGYPLTEVWGLDDKRPIDRETRWFVHAAIRHAMGDDIRLTSDFRAWERWEAHLNDRRIGGRRYDDDRPEGGQQP